MKYLSYLLMPLLLISCASDVLNNDERKILNSSALYDPPSVTLLDGQSYQFKEGVLVGRGQKFYSQHAYTQALVESFNK